MDIQYMIEGKTREYLFWVWHSDDQSILRNYGSLKTAGMHDLRLVTQFERFL